MGICYCAELPLRRGLVEVELLTYPTRTKCQRSTLNTGPELFSTLVES